MALTDFEKELGRQVKTQWGTRDDFQEVLTEYRKRQSQPKDPSALMDSTQTWPSLEERIKAADTQDLRTLIPSVRQWPSGVSQPLPGSAEDLTVKKAIKSGWEDVIDESWFDAWVKLWQDIIDFWEKEKVKATWKESAKELLKIADQNIWPDFAEAVWETIQQISDPVGTIQSMDDLAGALSDKLVFGVLNKISGLETEPLQDRQEVLDAVTQNLIDNYGTVERAKKSFAENPVDTITIVRNVIPKRVKTPANKKKLDKTLNEAEQNISQFLAPSKVKTTAKAQKITPEFIKKLQSWEIKPNTREEVLALSKSRLEDIGDGIDDFVKSNKFKWEFDVWLLIDDLNKFEDEIFAVRDKLNPADTTKFTKLLDYKEYLEGLAEQGGKLSADEARTLRQMFDTVYEGNKGVIEKFEDRIKERLGNTLRSELWKENPDLAKLNSEYAFYKWMEDILSETVERRFGKWEGGWLETKQSAFRTRVWTGVWAWVWGLAGSVTGPQWAVIWAWIWSFVGNTIANKIDQVASSPKYKLVKAADKAKLADALARWDRAAAIKILNGMSQVVWVAGISEQLQNDE